MVTRIEFREQNYNEREYNSEIDTLFLDITIFQKSLHTH